MYKTSIDCEPAGQFSGKLVVSMRPLSSKDTIRSIQISSRFPAGNLELIWIDLIVSFELKGLIDTTSFPENCPAGSQSIEVLYIGTIVLFSMCWIGIPASIKGSCL